MTVAWEQARTRPEESAASILLKQLFATPLTLLFRAFSVPVATTVRAVICRSV